MRNGEWTFGPIVFRHYNHNLYFPNCIGRWYVRVFWREIAIE